MSTSATIAADRGLTSGALKTTVLPHMIAHATARTHRITGPFHGEILKLSKLQREYLIGVTGRAYITPFALR